MQAVYITRPENGITLNGTWEYLLDAQGEPWQFPNRTAAVAYLYEQGLTRVEMEYLHAPYVGETYERLADMPFLLRDGDILYF